VADEIEKEKSWKKQNSKDETKAKKVVVLGRGTEVLIK